MPTRISMIRHGETAWNVNGRLQGHAAVPLNDEGRRQAALLAEHLYPKAAEITAIYSSDLSRTRETAEIIAARLGKTVLLDPRLREIDLGEWQGLTYDEVTAWDGDRLKAVQADSFGKQRPGGESFGQVADRAVQVIEEIIHAQRNGHVLVVSHGGTIRSVLIKLGLYSTPSNSIGNTSITAVLHDHEMPDTMWKLDVYNLMDHLGVVRLADSQG
jgi:broad specificity phosphatase PhoE